MAVEFGAIDADEFGFVVVFDSASAAHSGSIDHDRVDLSLDALDVDDILKHYGADVCRWWISSLSYEGDVKADLKFIELAGESYRKVRNTLRFLLSNLSYPEFPEPLGVIYDSGERETYEDVVHGQIRQAIETSGEGDLQALLSEGETWFIEDD